MGHKLRMLAGMAAVIAVAVWLAPTAPTRDLPTPEPTLAAHGPGRIVVDLVDGPSDRSDADLETIEARLAADLDWTSPLSRDDGLIEGDVADVAAALASLADHPLVEAAEPALTMEAFGFPNDPLYDKQWHMRAMGAPAGWASTPRGKGVIVAVVDTGVTVVEDLAGTHVLAGSTFVPGTRTAADDNGHGTHVAGTIAQTTNNAVGVTGVAPNATILPIKVLSGAGFGMSSWIASGIDQAVDDGADVINLSLGGSYSLVIHTAIQKARKKGVIVVAAAGNSGRRGVGYPGALAETIGVSATGPTGAIAPYSSFGKGVDIAAPGGNKREKDGGVWQDTIDGKGGHTYGEFQGTSMASPHVAGAAAILLSTGACDAECTERILLTTAKGSGEWDEKYGFGQLDLQSALAVTDTGHGGTRFALGTLFALLVTSLAGIGGRFRTLSALAGGLAAGGLFFLDALPVQLHPVTDLLGTGVLAWPDLFFGPWASGFPLWCSALLPAVLAFTLGASRGTRAVALGFSAGFGASLLHASLTGAVTPWLFPATMGAGWLGLNATGCLLLALGLAGTEKLDREGRR